MTKSFLQQAFLPTFALPVKKVTMGEKQKEYNGFWKQLGCILSVIAILGILAVFAIGAYLFFKGA